MTATEAGVILNQNRTSLPGTLDGEKGKATPQDLSSVPARSFRQKTRHGPQDFSKVHTQQHACCFVPSGMPTEDFVRVFDGLTPEGIPVEFKCPQGNTLCRRERKR